MHQIENVGITEGETHDVVSLSESFGGEEEGVSSRRIVVLSAAGIGERLARMVIDELSQRVDLEVEREHDYSRRVGGLMHLPLRYIESLEGPGSLCGYFPQAENYFDYRQRLREEEVARQLRRPPKKAVCSSRRRGRKFKG